MCGIGGAVTWRGPRPRDKDIRASLDRLAPRGPDGEGTYEAPSGHATLWHRRLAIVDLSLAGKQPMVTEDGRFCLVANGEIYNHQDLRTVLEKQGTRFFSHSDSEVLLHGYRAWGRQLVDRLDGIFAFAVWDDEKQSLYLARDRMGVKPLYYAQTPQGLSFASTIDALVGVDRAPDVDAFAHYWAFGHFDHGQSALLGVKKLDPGHELLIGDGRLEGRRYHQIRPRPVPSRSSGEWLDAVDTELERSVRSQLMSDVPVECFSPGASTPACCVSWPLGCMKDPSPRFSLGFAEWPDELELAAVTAKATGVAHHQKRIGPADILDALPEIVDAYDEPLADTSCIPTYFVSALARQHDVLVVLSGDGGDELFAGYRRYPWLLSRYRRTWPLRGWSSRADRLMQGFRMSKLLRIAPRDWLHQALPRRRLGYLMANVMAQDMPRGAHPGLAFQVADLRRYLPLDLLTKVDRASMAHGIEARVPFLSNGLIDLALQIPATEHHDQGETKPLLRALARRHLPREVSRAPKEGFALPFEGLFSGLRQQIAQALRSSSVLIDTGVLDPASYRAGLLSPRASLSWAVILAELWALRHLAGASLDELRATLSP